MARRQYGEVDFEDHPLPGNPGFLRHRARKRWWVSPDCLEHCRAYGKLGRGRVLECGLGLGITRRVLKGNDEVSSVLTVENNPEIVRAFRERDPACDDNDADDLEKSATIRRADIRAVINEAADAGSHPWDTFILDIDDMQVMWGRRFLQSVGQVFDVEGARIVFASLLTAESVRDLRLRIPGFELDRRPRSQGNAQTLFVFRRIADG